MYLVIGGMGQGQSEYAQELVSSAGNDGADIIFDYHLQIKKMLGRGEDPYAYTEKLMNDHPDACIVMDEIGCGVVPADPFEREYRETAGRIGCIIAERAQAVYRVFCGIPIRIK